MTVEQRQQVEELFEELAPLSFVEQESHIAAIHDLTVRDEVQSLLAFADPESGDLESAVGSAMRAATEAGSVSSADVGPGMRVDRYRIVRKLGQGGMGTVFSAERDDLTFDKQVALKVLHLGMDSPASLDRFRQERQILASLEHPYIARLIDGGETAAGLPYIVLEQVDGIPITEYCTRHELSRESRLTLFLKVCEAVEYAHRNLIVHRDLKPANILVTVDGTPKLLDFGIAKLIDANAQRTMTVFQALTPDYASPEQVRGEIITTASDVYSMGVVLYELLTERRPYRIATLTPVEIERTVCETQPERANLSEDLDTILMMALRKEPSRRYGTVRQFAEDIERSMTHRPVLARPDTIRYRTRKFVRRNWSGLAAATLALSAIVAGSAVALYQGRLAQQRFEQVRKLAHNYVFDLHDEVVKIEGSTRARQMMVRTALEYLDNLAKTAGNDLELKRELASAYTKVGDAEGAPTKPSLGRTADAAASYRKAGELYREVDGKDPSYRLELAQYYANYGQLLRFMQDMNGARAAALNSIQTNELVRQLVRSWCLLGDIDDDLQHYEISHDEYSRCTALAQKALLEKRDLESLVAAQAASERVGTSDNAIGLLTEAARNFDEDEGLVRELLQREPLNPIFHRTETVLNQYRSTLYYDDIHPNFGDPAKSLVYARRYLETARIMHEKDLQNISARASLAIALFRLSLPLKEFDPEQAVRAARESVAIFDDLVAEGKKSYLIVSRRARALRRLSQALTKAGQGQEARKLAEAALAEQNVFAAKASPLSEDRFFAVLFQVDLAKASAVAGDTVAAEQMLKESRDAALRLAAIDPGLLTGKICVATIDRELAALYLAQGKRQDALQAYERLVKIWREAPGANEYVALQRIEAARLLTAASRHS